MTSANVYPLYREAYVVSRADPQGLGRIQLRVVPELAKTPENDLPWAFPSDAGRWGKSFTQPDANQLITCIVWNKYWSEISYLPCVISKPTEHLYDDWMSRVRPGISDMQSDPEEGYLTVDETADGFSVFHDTGNSEHGIVSPSGTYVTINEDGDINISGTGKVNLNITGDVSLTSNGQVTIEASSQTTIKAPQHIVDANIFDFKGSMSKGEVSARGEGVFCGLAACLCSGTPHIG